MGDMLSKRKTMLRNLVNTGKRQRCSPSPQCNEAVNVDNAAESVEKGTNDKENPKPATHVNLESDCNTSVDTDNTKTQRGWSCTRCTLINSEFSLRCIACSTRKPVDDIPSVDSIERRLTRQRKKVSRPSPTKASTGSVESQPVKRIHPDRARSLPSKEKVPSKTTVVRPIPAASIGTQAGLHHLTRLQTNSDSHHATQHKMVPSTEKEIKNTQSDCCLKCAELSQMMQQTMQQIRLFVEDTKRDMRCLQDNQMKLLTGQKSLLDLHGQQSRPIARRRSLPVFPTRLPEFPIKSVEESDHNCSFSSLERRCRISAKSGTVPSLPQQQKTRHGRSLAVCAVDSETERLNSEGKSLTPQPHESVQGLPFSTKTLQDCDSGNQSVVVCNTCGTEYSQVEGNLSSSNPAHCDYFLAERSHCVPKSSLEEDEKPQPSRDESIVESRTRDSTGSSSQENRENSPTPYAAHCDAVELAADCKKQRIKAGAAKRHSPPPSCGTSVDEDADGSQFDLVALASECFASKKRPCSVATPPLNPASPATSTQTLDPAAPSQSSPDKVPVVSVDVVSAKRDEAVNPYRRNSTWLTNAPSRQFLREMEKRPPKPPSVGWKTAVRPKVVSNVPFAKPDDLFEDDAPGYAYKETVRCKNQRSKLACHDCEECSKWYAMLKSTGHEFSQDPVGFSRHRSRFQPHETPEDFWEMSFVDEKHAREQEAKI